MHRNTIVKGICLRVELRLQVIIELLIFTEISLLCLNFNDQMT